jgi:DNA (cytosine-5)-methyltransferase 1
VAHKLEKLLKTFVEAGYLLGNSGPMVLNAAEFGVPQNRRRAFIVGFLDPQNQFVVPRLEASPESYVRDGLSGLPNARSIERNSLDRTGLSASEVKRLENASEYAKSLRQPRRFEYPRLWNSRSLTGHFVAEHSPEVTERFGGLLPGERDRPSRSMRLDLYGRSPTLRAGTGVDHGSFTAVRPIHPQEPRVITVREAARLHSFPDWFDFHGTKWHALRQIGNSVPPRLAEAVAAAVGKTMDITLRAPDSSLKLGDESLRFHSYRSAARLFGVDLADLPRDVRK